jgi:hypothetical protein
MKKSDILNGDEIQNDTTEHVRIVQGKCVGTTHHWLRDSRPFV